MTIRSLASRFLALLTLAVALGPTIPPSHAGSARESLAGRWRFEIDRDNRGLSERWFDRTLTGNLQLPGALQNQGFGDDIALNTAWTGDVGADHWRKRPEYAPYREPGHIKVPFFLQPAKHYVGAVWYQRLITIPAAWAGRHVTLTLERPHWETRVWLDDRPLGTNDSLSTRHVYDLGAALTAGPHRLTIRVDNGLLVDVGSWAHSVTDHTQGNWNGVVGRLELAVTDAVWIDDLQLFPHVATRSVTIRGRLGNASGEPGEGTLHLRARPVAGKAGPAALEVPVTWTVDGGGFQAELPLGDGAPLWDEFHPALYEVTAQLDGGHESARARFGLREFGTTSGRLFAINGRPTYLRGTLECCIFPLTGYPPTEVEPWRRIVRIAQAHGLNHLRFHSWCPPEAAFVAADELGFYFSVEIAAWTTIGDGKPIDAWLYREADRILRAYGNHPSFVLMPYGNEPGGAHHAEYLAPWVSHWKTVDPRRLYTSASAWPQLPENDYHVTPGPRGPHGWGGGDYREAVKDFKVPAIVHEMGQWCVYPNFDEMRKYTGPLKPRNFDIFRDSLAAHGMLDEWRDFLRASGRLQTLCYKEEIEAAFRTPGVGGVQLLDLHDFPGQGTALVGVLDPFWDTKGYVTPAEFKRFFGPTVPLARLPKRVWTTAETLTAELELAHFGPAPIESAAAHWRLEDARGRAVRSGVLPAQRIPVDRGVALGRLTQDLRAVPAPAQYRLVVRVEPTGARPAKPTRLDAANAWNLWLYPATVDTAPAPGLIVASAFDETVAAQLAAGARVVLFSTRLPAQHPRGSFAPIFWNKYMFDTQKTTTLGLICDPRHPALARFPTEDHTEWQWEQIVARSRCVVLDGLPAGLRPIVQWIDDWNSNRRLGLVFECRVGAGRLLLCAADLDTELATRPAARQLRASLLAYAASPRFQPRVAVEAAKVAGLFTSNSKSRLVRLGARVIACDSEDAAHENVAANAIDGDPDTLWHTRWQPDDPMPHQLVIDLGRAVTFRGLTYLPRQDQVNGRIADAVVYISDDGSTWNEPVAQGHWPNTEQLQTLAFGRTVTARYLKVVVRREVNGNPFASLAELDLLQD